VRLSVGFLTRVIEREMPPGKRQGRDGCSSCKDAALETSSCNQSVRYLIESHLAQEKNLLVYKRNVFVSRLMLFDHNT
jgi:hypothetical protein